MRWAVAEPTYFVPLPHAGWSVHTVARCEVSVRYVWAGQSEHVRLAVLVSADLQPHVGHI